MIEGPPRERLVEVATGRKVRVDSGADGRDGLVVYHYRDDPQKIRRTITREACFLNGSYVADFEVTRA